MGEVIEVLVGFELMLLVLFIRLNRLYFYILNGKLFKVIVVIIFKCIFKSI